MNFTTWTFACLVNSADGLYSDFADTAVAARAMFLLKHDPDYATCLVNARRCETCND